MVEPAKPALAKAIEDGEDVWTKQQLKQLKQAHCGFRNKTAVGTAQRMDETAVGFQNKIALLSHLRSDAGHIASQQLWLKDGKTGFWRMKIQEELSKMCSDEPGNG